MNETPPADYGLQIQCEWCSEGWLYQMRNLSQNKDWQPASSVEVVEAINQRLQHPQRSKKVLWIGGVVAACCGVYFDPVLSAGIGLFTIFGYFWLRTRDSQRKQISLIYEGVQHQLNEMARVFEPLAQCQHLWEPHSKNTVQIQRGSLPGVACESQLTTFTNLWPTPYFAPDQLYLFDGQRFTACSYDQLRLTPWTFEVRETVGIPSDAKILRQEWQYQRKNGEPDRRHKNNFRLSVVEYGAVALLSGNAHLFQFACSNISHLQRFVTGWQHFLTTHGYTQIHRPAAAPAQTERAPQTKPESQSVSSKAERFVEVRPQNEAPTTASEQNERMRTRAMAFVQAAKERRTIPGHPSPYFPFHQYWPTYDDLNAEQTRWYFYWRGEVRRGNFLPTDTSYVFLHAYELVNLIEIDQPIEAAARLRLLSSNYHQNSPAIAKYLPEWCGDLLAAHHSIELALRWWREMWADATYAPELLNVLLQQAADQQEITQLPGKVWQQLAEFRPSVGFMDGSQGERLMQQAMARALEVGERYWRAQNRKSLIEAVTNTESKAVHKTLFASALYAGTIRQPFMLGVAPNFTASLPLRVHLKELFLLAENCVRQHYSKAPRRNQQELLPPALVQLLTHTLQSELAGSPISSASVQTTRASFQTKPLDAQRINQISRERDALVESMRVERQDHASTNTTIENGLPSVEENSFWEAELLLDTLDDFAATPVLTTHRSVIGTSQIEPAKPQETKPTFQAAPTLPPNPIGQPRPIIVRLRLDQAKVKELQSESAATQAMLQGMHEPEPEPMKLSATPPLPISTLLLTQTAPDVPNSVANSEGLNSWQRFCTQFSLAERSLIARLVKQGQLTESDVQEVASAHQMMTTLLIDALNERAVEILGTPLLYESTSHYEIETEELTQLQMYFQSQVNA